MTRETRLCSPNIDQGVPTFSPRREVLQGKEVHTIAMYANVRRRRVRDGPSISEIARWTSFSKKTIKDWLRGPVRSEFRCRRPRAPTFGPGHF